SKAMDASSVDIECSRTESKEQDTSNRLGNDAHDDDDADIRPIYDEDPMATVKMSAKIDVFAIGKQHTEQPKFNNEGEVVQNAEECHDTCQDIETFTGTMFLNVEQLEKQLDKEDIQEIGSIAAFNVLETQF
nr:hypothetical protein [Tanacetum cinerariifolium]